MIEYYLSNNNENRYSNISPNFLASKQGLASKAKSTTQTLAILYFLNKLQTS